MEEMKGQEEVAPQMNPKVQKEAEAYITGLSKMLHSKETSRQVVGMLEAGDPQVTVPETALQVNSMMEQSVKKKPSLDVLVNAGAFLVSDLIEIGNAAGIFEITEPEQIEPILKSTMQTYIEKGLADGSIDPVELQNMAEPMMDEEHRAAGLEGAEMFGVPTEANETTAMSVYGAQQKRKGMMQGGK